MKKQNVTLQRTMLLIIFLMGFLTTATATEFVRLSLEELTSSSSHVVKGKFVKIESFWNREGTAIYTKAVFQVQDTLKGSFTKEEISIYLPGGAVGDKSMIVIGTPEISIDEETVLMLQRVDASQHEVTIQADEEPFNIVALSQGKFDVRLDSTTNKMIAISHALKFFLKPEVNLEDLPPGGKEGLPLDEFFDRVREIQKKQLREEGK